MKLSEFIKPLRDAFCMELMEKQDELVAAAREDGQFGNPWPIQHIVMAALDKVILDTVVQSHQMIPPLTPQEVDPQL